MKAHRRFMQSMQDILDNRYGNFKYPLHGVPSHHKFYMTWQRWGFWADGELIAFNQQ